MNPCWCRKHALQKLWCRKQSSPIIIDWIQDIRKIYCVSCNYSNYRHHDISSHDKIPKYQYPRQKLGLELESKHEASNLVPSYLGRNVNYCHCKRRCQYRHIHVQTSDIQQQHYLYYDECKIPSLVGIVSFLQRSHILIQQK